MASISVDTVRANYPGMSDREAAKSMGLNDSSIEIIVRYKLEPSEDYSSFGICYTASEADDYHFNDKLYDTENIYRRKPQNYRLMPELIAAAEDGNLDEVKKMISEGADVNITNNDGWGTRNALTKAASKGHSEIVRCLVENGADLHSKIDEDGSTLEIALSSAAGLGWTKTVKVLIENCMGRVARKQADSMYSNAVFNASRDGHTDTVRLLIDNSASASVSALAEAAHGGHTETMRLLIENGTDIDPDNGDWSPLMVAANQDKVDAVKLLIESGANVNYRSEGGDSALHSSLALPSYLLVGSTDVVRILLECGINVGFQDANGDTASKIARDKDKAEIAEIIDNFKIDQQEQLASVKNDQAEPERPPEQDKSWWKSLFS